MNERIANMTDEERIDAVARHFEEIIELLGDDVAREGLVKTPLRAAKALWFLTSGYRNDASGTLKSALFRHDGSKVVIVKDIEFYSLCEHHILPFFGKVSIAYIPKGRIVGLSKLARAVNICARKLQVQERLTAEIVEAVSRTLDAEGVLVCCQAEHLCMKMRGVEKQDASTVTIDYSGKFADDPALRAETLSRF